LKDLLKNILKIKMTLNLMNEKQKWALLFGVMLGDGCLSNYMVKGRKKGRSKYGTRKGGVVGVAAGKASTDDTTTTPAKPEEKKGEK